jgi:hypothetical protein
VSGCACARLHWCLLALHTRAVDTSPVQVKRIGKYKSAGDMLLCKDMSEADREQLSVALQGLYTWFLAHIAKVCLGSRPLFGLMLQSAAPFHEIRLTA